MMWQSEHEDEVDVDECLSRIFITTTLKCPYCPCTATFTLMMPAEYRNDESTTDEDTSWDEEAATNYARETKTD